MYPAPTQNAHPHDGLNVDAHNRIWFTEEFANKLAEAVQTSVTPTPSPVITLAQDNFQRPNQALWGTASMVKRGEEMPTQVALSRSSIPLWPGLQW